MKIIFVTSSDSTTLFDESNDRRFTVIHERHPLSPKVIGWSPEFIVLDDVTTPAPKPQGQKGPTKNRKWWQK